ncbi:hypothetical protein PFICI_04939 [Pestalotiopsis fici W106-1]|uniref:Phosphoglycerate mutase n=1 Tax=Pestalotiopsis fici (strain W106-1 / CGMCC3.15140) TaxID=1229662 RepID=W3XAD4_PESFW|nr:uncharacterized protein PFICI_04939 [Pestalotiopsis fici W106-1]ETS83063.1 hypothetical protein PFICI_04939 [Pestalotiopsis fici W106-1]
MGRPPAYLFVVRHGNRLDAADKQWHMTSPTPYDPPLTYGGWLQCRQLGARIASILQEKEAEDEAARASHNNGQNGNTEKPKKKRYRVVLHSSPFLRCIQTSIAISAGIASSPSPFTQASDYPPARLQASPRPQTPVSSDPVSPRTRPALMTDIPPMQPTQNSDHLEKTILRLDPFLGEWASPDYFDHITPPPRSSLMLMTAKAELLRKENYITYTDPNPRPSTPTTPSRLWNSPTQSRNASLDGLVKPGDAPAGSLNNGVGEHRGSHKVAYSESAIFTGYIAPVPAYAISPSEPIPQGYVAHARDACVDIDYQWDSSRNPIAWGDGGVLPEEWAAMHQRFRKGLKRLVDWYMTTDHPGHMVTKTPITPNPSKLENNNTAKSHTLDDEEDIEDVVILVSHGAGCNALVGGITNQPVLADVPMTSLSMARRRPGYAETQSAMNEHPVTSLDDGLSRKPVTVQDLYELSMFANTDHLVRSGNVSRSSSVAGASRGHSRGLSSALRDINFGAHYGQPRDHRSNSMSSSISGPRNMSGGTNGVTRLPPLLSNNAAKGGITVGSGVTSFGTAPRKNSWGLWTPKQEPTNPEEELDMPMTLDFSHEKEVKKSSPPPETIIEMPEHEHGHLPGLPASIDTEEHDKFDSKTSIPPSSGMWGSPRPPDDAETLRDFSSQKRRWTVTERQL